MSALFTPGPWQAKHDYTLEGATTIIANVDGEIHSDGTETHTYEFIATCEDEYGDRSLNSQANARLIAAAPELYEAGESIIRGLRSPGEEWSSDELVKALTNLRAALAKARGDQ